MNRTALTLVIAGALNWLLFGLFQIDLVALIFGGQAGPFSRIVYVLIGIAGIWAFSFWGKVEKEESFEEETRRERYQSRIQSYNLEFGKDFRITDNQGNRIRQNNGGDKEE